ncbi:hypothetical protein CI109_102547 [Kwoniella shandongensis]|uniref:Uncharacterized protein n=1 Tax=Kwoniella shandongensis TaxID=1734106 RepID=A0A5M6BWH5_9TREE|nr:uncharacterized protein CI109_005838 [Kwoniella shandongensis]KAA5525815.1 hypothetical protein CI109_005838 [Kwoniella shandongensis]
MFDKLRAKINSHHSSHPLSKQRAEFLAVKADTPLERKAHFTHEVVGAAAAYEAFKAFENHDAHRGVGNGGKVSHARAKEIVVGLATGYVIKLVEEKKLPFTSEKDKTKFITLAQKDATADAKRAVRESGLYEPAELEGIDDDEKHGSQILKSTGVVKY